MLTLVAWLDRRKCTPASKCISMEGRRYLAEMPRLEDSSQERPAGSKSGRIPQMKASCGLLEPGVNNCGKLTLQVGKGWERIGKICIARAFTDFM